MYYPLQLQFLRMLMTYLNNFLKTLENRDYPSLLSLWEEYCLGETLDLEELCSILEAVKKSELMENFGRHVENILPLLLSAEESDRRFSALNLLFDVQTSNSDELWNLVTQEIEKRYAANDHYQDKLRILGLKQRGDFRGALSNFELLNHMKRGKFVFHLGGWGVGEVMESSLLREELSVEFDYVPGKKELSFKNAFKMLIPLPDDHFLALRFGTPDQLEEEAKANPTKVIRKLLQDLGPKTAQEIKDELAELVIPEEEWTKWWQTARAKLKKDRLIEMPPTLSAPFKLRKKEIAYEDRLQEAFEKKLDACTLIHTIYAFLKDFSNTLKNDHFRTTLEDKLRAALSIEELTDAEEVQILFFLQDLSPKKEHPAIHELIKRLTSIDEVLEQISILAFKKRLLSQVRSVRSDWKEIFLHLFLKAGSHPIRDMLLSELLEAGEHKALEKKLEELTAHPSKAPEVFIWYFQKLLGKKGDLPFATSEGLSRFFEAFFVLLHHLEQMSGAKELIKKMHTLLIKDRYALVRAIMKDAQMSDVREFLLLATKCHSLSDHDIKILHSLAEVAHPKLAAKKSKVEEPEFVIWTTQEGYLAMQEKIKRIATVETVETAKEIETARAHGDLRENAEFKAALEKRDRLQAELKLFSDQLSLARILTPQDIPEGVVGVGSVVEFENREGQRSSYTLLGPWDADPEKNILSFQSKLAQSMVGRKMGDTVPVQGEGLKIVGIRSFLR